MKSNDQKVAVFYLLKKLFLILAVALIVSVALDFGISKKNDGANEQSNNNKPDSKPIPVQEKIVVPKVIYNLSGRITKIDGNTVIFNAEIFSVDDRGERSVREEQRMAIVNSQTKINSLFFVDRSPVEKKIGYGDLKTGDYVEIISSSNISEAKEFIAVQIRVKQAL